MFINLLSTSQLSSVAQHFNFSMPYSLFAATGIAPLQVTKSLWEVLLLLMLKNS